jgi:membrane protease YdiL (CAAX protease family)
VQSLIDAGAVAEQKGFSGRTLLEVLGVTALVTGIATLASIFVPLKHEASAVGVTFLVATWILVWQKDDVSVARFGLTFAGLVLPGKLDYGRVALSAAKAAGWALLVAAVVFVPFFFGWRWWWKAGAEFHLVMKPYDLLNEALGQLLIISLPEEAFYRGYVQTRLDDALPRQIRVLGAKVGPSLFITSLLFALGHFATVHHASRLAVFFPSLLFGWLRSRTGGIGAGVIFHAMCNMFSVLLGKGYGVYP